MVRSLSARAEQIEPPLLEELGVNFGHIKTKVCHKHHRGREY